MTTATNVTSAHARTAVWRTRGGLDLDWKDVPEAAPAFLCAITMPFTWSISNGIGAGVIAHVFLMTAAGRRVHPIVWCVAAAFAAFFALG